MASNVLPKRCDCATEAAHIEHLLRNTCDSKSWCAGKSEGSEDLVSAACGHIFHKSCHGSAGDLMTFDVADADGADTKDELPKAAAAVKDLSCSLCGDHIKAVTISPEFRAALKALLEEAAADLNGHYDWDAIFGHESLSGFDPAAVATLKQTFLDIAARTAEKADTAEEEEDMIIPGLFQSAEEFAVDVLGDGTPLHGLFQVAIRANTADGWVDVEAAFASVDLSSVPPNQVGLLKSKYLDEYPPKEDAEVRRTHTRSRSMLFEQPPQETPEEMARRILGVNYDAFVALLEANVVAGGLHDFDTIFDDATLKTWASEADLAAIRAAYEEEEVIESESDDEMTAAEYAESVLEPGEFTTFQEVIATYTNDDGSIDVAGAFADASLANIDAEVLRQIRERYEDEQVPELEAPEEQADPLDTAVTDALGDGGLDLLQTVLNDYENADGTYNVDDAFADARIRDRIGQQGDVDVDGLLATLKAAYVTALQAVEALDPLELAKSLFEDGDATTLETVIGENTDGESGLVNKEAVSSDQRLAHLNQARLQRILAKFPNAATAADAPMEVQEQDQEEDPPHVKLAKEKFGTAGYDTLVTVLADHVLAAGVHDLDSAFEDTRISQTYDEYDIRDVKDAYFKLEEAARDAYLTAKAQKDDKPADPPAPTHPQPQKSCFTPCKVATIIGVAAVGLGVLSQVPVVQEVALQFANMTLGDRV